MDQSKARGAQRPAVQALRVPAPAAVVRESAPAAELALVAETKVSAARSIGPHWDSAAEEPRQPAASVCWPSFCARRRPSACACLNRSTASQAARMARLFVPTAAVDRRCAVCAPCLERVGPDRLASDGGGQIALGRHRRLRGCERVVQYLLQLGIVLAEPEALVRSGDAARPVAAPELLSRAAAELHELRFGRRRGRHRGRRCGWRCNRRRRGCRRARFVRARGPACSGRASIHLRTRVIHDREQQHEPPPAAATHLRRQLRRLRREMRERIRAYRLDGRRRSRQPACDV